MKMVLAIESKNFDKNQIEELMQKTAWKLVRSAADRFGDGKGEKKLQWGISKMQSEYPGLGEGAAEDHVRAAYTNYKVERG